jgi:hypothetical protein
MENGTVEQNFQSAATLTKENERLRILENTLDNALVVSHLGTLKSFPSPLHAILALVEFDLSLDKFFEAERIESVKLASDTIKTMNNDNNLRIRIEAVKQLNEKLIKEKSDLYDRNSQVLVQKIELEFKIAKMFAVNQNLISLVKIIADGIKESDVNNTFEWIMRELNRIERV